MIEKNGKLIPKYGTGFFCDIPEKNLKVFITNNHVINEDFLKKEKKIKFEIGKENKEINLELKRYKMTDKFYDFTIIEILKEDNINNFLKVDKYINEYDYKDQLIFSTQYPGGKKLGYSHGKITGKKSGYFLYSVGTKGGFSGSPIILFDDLTVIGLHKGCLYDEDKNKINLGIPLNIIIERIYSIICIYKINKVDLNKDIQIVNNGYYDYDKHNFIEKNKEI